MAKLTGKAKAAFLARMNKGRIAAGLKKIASKAKGSSSNRSKKTNRSPMAAKTKTKRKAPTKENFNNGFKGFLGGVGAGELIEEAILIVTQNPVAVTVGKVGASVAGGYYTGHKTASGVVGGLVGAGLDIGLKLITGRAQTQTRFSL